MKTLKLIFVMLLAAVLPAGNVLAGETMSAYESVVQSTDVLLGRLVEVQPLYETDPARFFSEVESALTPYVDFDGFAKGVMAKYYREATEAQREAFRDSFREALIKTYATALLEFDNQEVKVLEPSSAENRPDRATITLEIYARSGTVYPVLYQLGLEDNRWLLRNVIINGINIGLQFRSQFNAYMQKHRGNIDKVIENWTVDVASEPEST